MYPDLAGEQFTSQQTMVIFDAPQKSQFAEFEMESGSENDCKCGANCTCSSSCKVLYIFKRCLNKRVSSVVF
ncbi:hypothetical protein LUZ60_012946 [Juncus effusus]|nr:hypothetical protein LUZ60_012946 [Juncus effusus]